MTLISAERIIFHGHAYPQAGISINEYGRVQAVGYLKDMGKPDLMLHGKVLLPGYVNAHSQSFQRLMRGRTHFGSPNGDSYETWQENMLAFSACLDVQSVYLTARQAFLELLLQGVTTVGEFHYVFNKPDGSPYENPHELTDAVIQAAKDIGIRISLLYTLYLKGDFDTSASPRQKRFVSQSLDSACDLFDKFVERLIKESDRRVGWGIAAHSLGTVPIDAVIGLKLRLSHMPFHIQAAEQSRDVDACFKKYGKRPVELLTEKGVVDACTTLIHATHVLPHEIQGVARKGGIVCICPSTDADLGAGFAPVSEYFQAGVSMCLGTGNYTLSSVVEEARRLEMHERLRMQRRNVITRGEYDAVAWHLHTMATRLGGSSLGLDIGLLHYGKWADFITYDLNDPALVGSDDNTLLSSIIFSSETRSVRDVFVAGKHVVKDGEHPLQQATSKAFDAYVKSLFPVPENQT